MKNKKDKKTISCAVPPQGDVFDAQDAVNKYGTYNIQPTADTKNLFPQISQGLPRQTANKRKKGNNQGE